MKKATLIMLAALLTLPALSGPLADDLYLDGGATSVGPRSLYIVDSPTAAVIGHSSYRVEGRIMDEGAVVLSTSVGIKDRFMVGVSWGMENLLGKGEIDFNDNTAVSIRLLIVEEGAMPAIAVGFEDQGYGQWDSALNRYERKSKGFYVTGTRNWYGPMDSDVATTAGFNYTTETDDDESVDFFLGMEQDFGNEFALLLDYSLGLNDRVDDVDPPLYGGKKGWLDVGLRWNLQEQIQFKFYFRDLLGNSRGHGSVDRHMVVSYESSF